MVKKKKIKVLIVDDSFFMKKLLRELLSSDSSIEVVGEAKTGSEAIGETLRLKPDVITMDYNMPGMTGAEAIRTIINNDKLERPAIIMLSAYAKEGADETIECLRAGAVDFIAKPSGELSLDIEKIREDILKKIHTAKLARIRRFPGTKKRSGKVSFKNIKGSKIIVIGASTGGPPVVEDILLALPKNIPATIFVAQHMPDFFISRFAERLDKLMDLKVKVLSDNSLIAPKQVIIVNDNFKIIGDKIKRIKICKVDEECGARPSIDSTMISLSKAYGKKVIGIMLSGMGEDGFEGFKEIRRNKGFTIAQDLKTAVITSMPETVIEAGLTDSVLSPNKIAKKIIELCSE